ncbi:phage late control D family protein [Sphingomonas sp. PL-96]|uniref:contractile injection system protein, VgrG/Pvc8 family n=1 Tax=Sphingomonas sp. PL-96 TaxID=2887201 RepID=UPI001E3B786E|nr:contractile injection system protein, VgrG/Pvc8 family [Sphingomonas sp. PL-96]MCC2976231.1 phage late control D family protein [Sphingomonas sp. PL-96]
MSPALLTASGPLARSMSSERRQNVADFRLTMDGQDFTDRVRPRLVSLRLSEKRGGEADDLDLVLDDSDGKLVIPRKGVRIHLVLGWRCGADVNIGMVDKGSFTVDEASWDSAPDTITIRARSADLTGGYRVRRERSHRATTLGAIVAQVAAAHGYTPHVDAALASVPVDVLVQDQRSDMAMIRTLGRQHDAVATVKNGRLILQRIGAGSTSSGRELPTATILRSDVDRATWRTVDRDAYTKVEARWHDQDGATRKTVAADVAGRTGGSDDKKVRRLKKTYHTEADARAAAQAEAGRVARRGAELTLDLGFGRPDLYPEQRVKVAGFKAAIDAAAWIIAKADHALDGRGGLTTSLGLETA